MRFPRTFCVIAVAAAMLSGCVVTHDAVVAEADAEFDARLLGTWKDSSDGEIAVVTRGAGSRYMIEYMDEGDTTRLEARLGRLGDRRVLDVWPAPRRGELPSAYVDLLLPAHVPILIDVAQDEIRVWMLNVDSLRAEMRARPERWSWEEADNRVVLRGTTAELRAALGPYVTRLDLGAAGLYRRTTAR